MEISIPVSEAIVCIDIVGSTKTFIRHGWQSVGKHIMNNLRECVMRVGTEFGLCCQKFTGDGYMLAFRNEEAAEQAVHQALQAVIAICHQIKELNSKLPEQQRIRLRSAIHYGEVYVVSEDREGPEVTYTFRLEGVDSDSILEGLRLIAEFPDDDYAILSDEVVDILAKRREPYAFESIGLMHLKGFRGYHQLFLLRNLSEY